MLTDLLWLKQNLCALDLLIANHQRLSIWQLKLLVTLMPDLIVIVLWDIAGLFFDLAYK